MQEVDEGQSLTLMCDSKGLALWYHYSLLYKPVYHGSHLVFDKVRKRDSGPYMCFGKYYNVKKLTSFISLIFLAVYGKIIYFPCYLGSLL